MNLRPLVLLALLVLAACGAGADLSQPPTPIGDFRLGYNIVVADNAESVGPSRRATADEWEAVVKDAVQKNIGRYQGDKLYHLGIGVNAYALAVPGVPLVLSPKSVLVLSVDVWDDTAQRTVNAETRQFTVFEGVSGKTMIGSGLTKSREEQMRTLADNAAGDIGRWLAENKAWFTPEAVAARAHLPPMAGPNAVKPPTAAAGSAAAAATPTPAN